jgi:hypothetical protein
MLNVQSALDFHAARARGSEAADACLEKAQRVAGFDADGARKFIVSQLVRHGQMSGEALVDAAKAHGYRPGEDRAFGSIFSTLVRRNLIRCVGFCERTKGHGTAGGRMWAVVPA